MKRTSWYLLTLLLSGTFCLTTVAQPSLQTLATNNLAEPYGVAVDADNNYYITDSVNNRIAKYNPNSGSLTNLAGVPGETGNNDGLGVFARFFNPQGIVSARGGMIVADSGNHRIRFISRDGNVSTIAGSSRGTNDGNGVAAQFNAPAGLAVDSAGNIYVADMLNNRVRKIDPNNQVTTVAASFLRPSAVAVDNNSKLIYVADTDNHSIRTIDANGTVRLFAGSGSSAVSGLRDWQVATNALFNRPRGLLWVGGNTGLLVSDTGNHRLRRIFFNSALNSYSTETYLSSSASLLSAPVGMAVDINGNIPLVDLGNNALYSVQVTAPQAPVANPQIGVVILTTNIFGQLRTSLVPITNSTFNNDIKVAILAERGTDTFYSLNPDANFPQDPASRNTPSPYENGLLDWTHTLINPALDGSNVTIRAISTQDGRRPSEVVTARFLFKCAGPVINGKNLAGFTIENATEDSELWYTVDGSNPVNGSPSQLYVPGTRLNIVDGTNNVLFKVRAFKLGYSPSTVAEKLFLYSDLQTSSIGITRDFAGGIGSTIIVPVEVKLALGDRLRSLQFRVELAPGNGASPISSQLRSLAISTNDFIRIPLPSTNAPVSTTYTDGDKTGVTVSFIGANTGLDLSDSGTVALLAVPIPPSASVGQTYTMSIIQPSGTSDGLQTPVQLSTFRDRTITVTNISYVVGDSAVATWYNAGDFGNGNINNNDINNVFHASLGLFAPYSFSDVFDAMDTFPEDSSVSVGGDGQIRFLDWQVALQRSLRLDPNNWSRSWNAGGTRIASSASLNGAANSPIARLMSTGSTTAWHRQACVEVFQIENAAPGSVVSVPVFLKVNSGYQIGGLQLRAVISADGNAPALVDRAMFNPNKLLPQPITIQGSQSGLPVNQAVAAWSLVENPFSTPLQGSTFLGEVLFTVPVGAQPNQSYTVRILNVDGAPNMQTQYEFESIPGSVWVGSRALKKSERISDEWKTHFFGGFQNVLASGDVDPDGDGISNDQEYSNGTNPIDLRLHSISPVAQQIKLRWFAQTGKRYQLESSSDLKNWSPITEVEGSGNVHEENGSSGAGATRFYRVRSINGSQTR